MLAAMLCIKYVHLKNGINIRRNTLTYNRYLTARIANCSTKNVHLTIELSCTSSSSTGTGRKRNSSWNPTFGGKIKNFGCWIFMTPKSLAKHKNCIFRLWSTEASRRVEKSNIWSKLKRRFNRNFYGKFNFFANKNFWIQIKFLLTNRKIRF